MVISTAAQMHAILKIVLSRFDHAAGGYYSAKHQKRGGLITSNRQYQKQFFPMMKLSCAVIDTAICRIRHYGELVEMATEREDPNIQIHSLLMAILDGLPGQQREMLLPEGL